MSRHLWPDDAPSLAEMRVNGSLFIVNRCVAPLSPIIQYIDNTLGSTRLLQYVPYPGSRTLFYIIQNVIVRLSIVLFKLEMY